VLGAQANVARLREMIKPGAARQSSKPPMSA
jgi:hypothetical protein